MTPRILKKRVVLWTIPGFLLLSCGGGATPPVLPTERGRVVVIQQAATFSAAQISGLISPSDPQAAMLARHEVKSYTLVYTTLDHRQEIVRASGGIMVPSARAAFPTVSLQHGTVTLRTRVASASPAATTEGLIGLLMASAGYFVCLPDYQGFGVSTAIHPYVHAKSLSTAVIDLLIAAEQAAPDLNVRPDGRLFLAGYSEGGYATLATHKEIEKHYSNRFNLVASAPMAGTYDLSGTARSLLAAETYPWPAYLAFFLTAYNEVYGWDRLGDIFKPPYAGMMPGLFDGTRDFSAVNERLPVQLAELLQERFVAGLLDGSEAEVVQAIAENDLLGWFPVAPIRFYHGDADDVAPYQNALTAVDSLSSGTNSVELVTIEGGTHETAGPPALLDMIRWFKEQ